MRKMVLTGFPVIFLLILVATSTKTGWSETNPILLGLVEPGVEDEGTENGNDLKSVYWLTPLACYQNGKYQNFEKEFEIDSCGKALEVRFSHPEQAFTHPEQAKEILEKFQKSKFWLYKDGEIVGEFVPRSPLKFECIGEVIEAPRIVGSVSTKLKMEEGGPIFALNQQIPQPYRLRASVLTKSQSQALKKVIESAFSDAFKKFKKNPKRFSGNGYPVIKVMDLERDGRPEVYVYDSKFDAHTTPSISIEVSLLLTWRNNQWVALLRGYSQRQGDNVISVGEGSFYVEPLDINGDGIAELIVSKWGYETFADYLYQLQKGKLQEVLYLIGGGD